MERVGDDVAFGLENAAWPMVAMRARVPEALGEVGLSGFEGRRSTRLSGGEQQRVAIAGVLAPAPGVLVLDEPTANLDPNGAAAVFGILAELRSRRSATIVLVEHRAELAWPIADVVLALDDDGRPIDVGPPADVLARSGPSAWTGRDLAARASRSQSERRERDAADACTRAASGSLPVLELRGGPVRLRARSPVLRAIDLTVGQGERVALVGRERRAGRRRCSGSRWGSCDPRPATSGSGARPGEAVGDAACPPRRATPSRIPSSASSPTPSGRRSSSASTPSRSATRASCATDFGSRSGRSASGARTSSPAASSAGSRSSPALARQPLLLALDEPTYGQDRRGHEALVAALDELVGQGSALLAATHDERFVRDATDRRVELAEGWIVEDAAAAAVNAAPDATQMAPASRSSLG